MESIYFVLEFKCFVMFRCTSAPLSSKSEAEVMNKAGSKNRKKQKHKSVPYIHKVQHKQQ